MRSVDERTYRLVVAWIIDADNYVGTPRHAVDGTTHYILVGGENKIAALDGPEDFGEGEFYRVDETVYQQWRTATRRGYTVG